ncbi:hypothetical protein DXG01_013116 [Tephrocybe rancida]|nr:hypothetical protein DXG01_013116 [Tephrocybe rancida]
MPQAEDGVRVKVIDTALNPFGVFWRFTRLPTDNSDNAYVEQHNPKAHVDISTFSAIPPHLDATNPYAPFPNRNSFLLSDWYWNYGLQKSKQNFQQLLQIISSPNFLPEDVSKTNWDQLDQQLGINDWDREEWLNKDVGWQNSSVSISVPFHQNTVHCGAKDYVVPDFYHRSLVEIISEKLTMKKEDAAHFHLELWCMPSKKLAEHAAFFQQLPDDFKDFAKTHSRDKKINGELMAHCNRELVHEQWRMLLDDDFTHAYEHSIILEWLSTCPHLGRDTIQRFSKNASELKKMAARDYEDLLQCILPVFDGLIPDDSINTQIINLLFQMAHWHGLAKLWLHSSFTLDLLDLKTTVLGDALHEFKHKVYPNFAMWELRWEAAARERREATKAAEKANKQTSKKKVTEGHTASTQIMTAGSQPESQTAGHAGPVNIEIAAAKPTVATPHIARKAREFSLSAYKLHAIGDYISTIQTFGTTDSYSTEMV